MRFLALLVVRLAALRGVALALALALLGPGLEAHAQPGPVFQLARPRARQAALKFDMQRNLIIVAAQLNGLGSYHFLLDTGVANSLITNPNLADSLHLTLGEELRVVGAGGEDTPLRAYRTNALRVELPGVVAPSMSWLILSEDALNLSGYAGTRIDGILGSEFFKSFAVAIWPLRGQLVCHAPARYQPPRRWESLPLTLAQGKAYVEAGVAQLPATAPTAPAELSLPLQLLLDTGAGHALSLETTADRRMHLPAAHLRADLGRGLSGVITGYLGRVGAVQLGRYQLPQVLTSFPDSGQVHLRLRRQEAQRQGNLGYEALKRFNLVIDYPHQRLLLRPNAHYQRPFEHDMSGLDLLAAGPGLRRCLIVGVVPGSPAAAAGIEPDEELLAINALPAALLSLSEIARLLRAQDGQRLHLVLRRPDGELRTATLVLRRQI
ncbi:MAG TPA: aspartyl protease family protein [Hymenobacter sp.]|uniref:aspartyl protease family protein n=1 Tax=Hymenobacter sp. TaxID=1898978 RepID=UPI002D7ED33B|nr:aspartyl protease family protein [Hymenobacter sp.]HET9505057.1 aspartyl protease family protein [Hymenobacter sp.]